MTKAQKIVFIVAGALALLIGLSVHHLLTRQSQPKRAALVDAGIILLAQSRAMPALQMTDQDGAAVHVDQLRGKWSLLFFGYTFCPDICPTTLANLRDVQQQLPNVTRERLQVVLISVDPHRDTPERLKQYLGYFKAGFEGWVAPVETLQTLASAISIPFIPADTRKPNYLVEHSANLALIGPDGRQRGFIRGPIDNAKMIAQLPGLVAGD
jgi:protein SCO1/2